jgi:hypothetical protein
MTGLSAKISQAVIREMILTLGEDQAAAALESGPVRLKALAGGKSQLSYPSLENIRANTGKTWRTWLLDAAKRGGISRQLLGPTTGLVNELNGAESDATANPRRRKRHSTSSVAG